VFHTSAFRIDLNLFDINVRFFWVGMFSVLACPPKEPHPNLLEKGGLESTIVQLLISMKAIWPNLQCELLLMMDYKIFKDLQVEWRI